MKKILALALILFATSCNAERVIVGYTIVKMGLHFLGAPEPDAVIKFLNAGWEPLGNPFSISGGALLYQAMVKYEEID